MAELIVNFNAVVKAISLLLPVGVVCTLLVAALTWLYHRFAETEVWRTFVAIAVFAAFGATIGMFMGASASPIVTSILPPVITMISGYLAFSAAKDMPPKIQIVVPGALLALLISLLFSAFYMKFWYVAPQGT